MKNLKLFSGIEQYNQPNSVPADKLYNCVNTRFSGKIATSKFGFQRLGAAATGGTRNRLLMEYPYFNVADGTSAKKLIRLHNGSFSMYDNTANVWDSIPTTWPSVADSDSDGIVYNNVAYFVNPMLTDTNGVGKLVNPTVTVDPITGNRTVNAVFSVVQNSPRGSAIESWVERLWVIGDAQSPNAVIGSRAASSANPTYVEDWSTTDGATIQLVGKGGRCVALKVINNNLYVWKDDSVWYNTPANIAAGNFQFLELSKTGGAVGKKAVCIVENDVWFLTPKMEVRCLSFERNFLTSDPRTKNLSEAIKGIMSQLDPDQSNASISYFNRVVKVNLRSLGSATENMAVVFDYNTGGWAVDRGQSVNCSCVWGNSLVFGPDGTNGQTYQDEIGYSSDGASFPFQVDTPLMDDTRPDTFKRARYIHFRGQQSYDQSVTLRLYRGDYKTYSEYVIPSPRTRGISIAVPSDGQQGSSEQGSAQWGGTSLSATGITLYRTEQLISVDRTCNMYGLGARAEINGGAVVVEQLILKLIDQNENYKRSDI